jgi:CheY-like chemotaxis protein
VYPTRRGGGPVRSRVAGWPVLAWPARTTPVRGLPVPRRHALPDDPPAAAGLVEVLIVEDAAMSEMYRIQLEVDGYRVRVAAIAEDALDAIHACPPDLVLLDVLLPGRDGSALLEQLWRPGRPAPPVVILSNYGEAAMVGRGLSLGALDYFVKSRVTPGLVSRAIPEWLDRATGS